MNGFPPSNPTQTLLPNARKNPFNCLPTSPAQTHFNQTNPTMTMSEWRHTVLDLLKGAPLSTALSQETSVQIRQLTAEIPLDELLHSINRPEAAVLIARSSEMSTEEKERCVDALVEKLSLPQMGWIWYVDDYARGKMEYKLQMEHQLRSRTLLNVLGQMPVEMSHQIVLSVGCYTMETPWSDSECVQLARGILSDEGFSKEVMDTLAHTIKLDMTVLKNSKVTQAGYKKLDHRKENALRPRLGFVSDEDNRHTWKTRHIRAIPLFHTFLQHISRNEIKTHWWLISPTILNILDDHEAPIKCCGVQLLSTLLKTIDPTYLQHTGVTPILEESLSPLLSYLPDLTPTPVANKIIKELYPTYTKLYELSTTSTREHHDKLLTLITDGIFFSFTAIADHHETLTCLLTQLSTLLSTLGESTIKILPRMVYHLGMILADPFVDVYEPLFYTALDCLVQVETACWRRLKGHKFDVLGMLVMSWSREHKSRRVEELVIAGVRVLIDVVGVSDDEWEVLSKQERTVEELRKLVE